MFVPSKITVLLTIFFINNVQSAFFDMTDVDDPLGLLWHTKDTIQQPKSGNCRIIGPGGTAIEGKCSSKSYCYLTGGKARYGPCGLFSTCCIHEQTACGQTSNAKVAYFESATRPFEDPITCKHTVKLINDNICQVRLDFDSFFLSPAAYDLTTSEFRCSIDYFAVEPNFYNIPKLCGDENQHVYIHVDNSTKQVDLTVNLGTRSTSSIQAISNPQWRIKITQLECPGTRGFFAKHTESQSISDFPSLAPVGAIQYFTETHGSIRSFGFRSSHDSPYTSPENYIVAFKRQPSSCRIRFTTNYIKLHTIADLNPIDPKMACGGYFFGNDMICTDDLSGSCTSLEPGSSKVCIDLQPPGISYVFTMTSPGPLNLQFVSEPGQMNDTALGFDVTYDLEHCDTF